MIETMPSISSMPINLPKLNTNFSVDWLINENKLSSKIANVEKCGSRKSPTSQCSETIPKDYDREISKALRLQMPSNEQHINAKLSCTVPTNRDTTSFCKDYRDIGDPPSSISPTILRPAFEPNFPKTLPNYPLTTNPALPMDAVQLSHVMLARMQMAAAFNYQHHLADSTHSSPMNFSQIFSNNFHRTGMSMPSWPVNKNYRIPYGMSNDYLLHPYRKPKRIRTAFAPVQLYELENAFEGNQYVVGSERRALAKTLNLTETQVKVWFQNRRTKQKRMQQENNGRFYNDDEIGSGNSNQLDDEEIVVDDTGYIVDRDNC